MAVISSEDFYRWKIDPVTRAFFEAAEQRVEDAKEILSNTAGSDSGYDRQLVGLIRAYREMQQFQVDDANDD